MEKVLRQKCQFVKWINGTGWPHRRWLWWISVKTLLFTDPMNLTLSCVLCSAVCFVCCERIRKRHSTSSGGCLSTANQTTTTSSSFYRWQTTNRKPYTNICFALFFCFGFHTFSLHTNISTLWITAKFKRKFAKYMRNSMLTMMI